MRGIVRGINASALRFMVEADNETFAVFTIKRGGLPYGGEYIRWNDEVEPITLAIGESSGKMIFEEAHAQLEHDRALQLLAAM